MITVERVLNRIPDYGGWFDIPSTSSMASVAYYHEWVTKQVYRCPRGLARHGGSSELCGRSCEKEQGSDPVQFENELELRLVALTTYTSINIY
ncbi:hypothetical protein BJY04DRAFT_113349 [Aspergillus karnatakaensis]|uniref:uncharacterized protein n=1 Tax=Aspergillus karnatakaensis TaxID=1810916 RepID=UPI003CCCE4B6